jgi:hypothetical protein
MESSFLPSGPSRKEVEHERNAYEAATRRKRTTAGGSTDSEARRASRIDAGENGDTEIMSTTKRSRDRCS